MSQRVSKVFWRILGVSDESRLERWTLIGILMYAAVIQSIGFGTMLPHPDELVPQRCSLRLLTDYGDPGWFGWPGQTLFMMLAAIYGSVYQIGRLFGAFADWNAFVDYYHNHPQVFLVYGRCLTTLFSLGVIALVHRIARRFMEIRYALAASFFTAASWLYSMESQFIRPDMLCLFFTLACAHFSLRIHETGRRFHYIAAGIALGCAVATKWVSAPVLISILLGHFSWEWASVRRQEPGLSDERYIDRWAPHIWWMAAALGVAGVAVGFTMHPDRVSAMVVGLGLSPDGQVNRGTLALAEKARLLSLWGGFLLLIVSIVCKIFPTMSKACAVFLSPKLITGSILTSLLAFMLFAPYIILDAPTAMGDVLTETRTVQLGAERLPGLLNPVWYLAEPLGWGYGYILQGLAITGVIIALAHGHAIKQLIFLVFPLLYFIVIAVAALRWTRWGVYLVPGLSVYSAVGLGYLVDKLRFPDARAAHLWRWALPVICLALMAGQIWRMALYDRLILARDTRDMSVEWILQNIPQDRRIAMDALAGEIPPGRYTILRELAHPSLSHRPLDYYLNEGWEIFVVSGDMYGRYFNERYRYPEQVAFYERLFEEGRLLKEFKPDPSYWPHPSIRLSRYHIHTSPEVRIYDMSPAKSEKSAEAGS